jgi:glyoxylase-like metal-dependent hydrolase (beta-lactamase superfamily II)
MTWWFMQNITLLERNIMNTSSYHFNVGEIKCTVINDGTLTYTTPSKLLFVNAPHDQLTQALLRHNIQDDLWDEWISPLQCFLIQTGAYQVLVDTGLGKVDFAPDAGLLLKHLHAEGIELSDIDMVIFTHAHGDHIGWNATPDGLATFPQARYIMRKEEWDFWTSDKTLTQPEHEWMTWFAQKQLLPLSSRFDLIQQDIEIVPGIHTLFAPGHTPGHMAVVISSKGEELLCIGDAMGHPLHVEQPDWYIEPDVHPDQAIRSRRALLARAATTRSLVFAFHFDFPGIGYVRQYEESWKWHPIIP